MLEDREMKQVTQAAKKPEHRHGDTNAQDLTERLDRAIERFNQMREEQRFLAGRHRTD